jgi:hypothetical protein
MEISGSKPIYIEKIKKKTKRIVLIGVGLCGLFLAGIGILYGGRLIGSEGDVHKIKENVATGNVEKDSIESLKREESETIQEKSLENQEQIAVIVETEPKGAIVSVEGKGQVCGLSPCEVSLEKDVAYEISARLDTKIGNITFTASQQNKYVKIVLKEPPERVGDDSSRERRRERRNKKVKEKEEKEPEKTPSGGDSKSGTKNADGLKIPDVFKE